MRKKIRRLDENPVDYESTTLKPILSTSALPNGWSVSPVRQIAQIVRGVSYGKSDAKETNSEGHTPILRATNIQDNGLVLDRDLVYVPNKYISEGQKLKIGDIVIATSSGSKYLVGKTAQVKKDWPGSFGAFCAVVRPTDKVEPRYLGYFFNSPIYKSYISAKAMGVNINNLRRGDIEELRVPLASIKEQQRIVSEIEKQFSRLDEAVANLKRVKANLKRYKAAVLKAAVEGKLTEAWRKQHPHFLLNKDSIRGMIADLFKKKKNVDQDRAVKYREADWFYDCSDKIPPEWDQVRLIDVTRLITCGVAKKPDYVETGVPFLSAQNSKPFAPNLNDIKFVSEDDFRTFTVGGKPEQGDVLYSRVGANFGEACVIPWSFDFAIYVSLTLIKQDRNVLDGRFLVIFLNSLDGVLQSRGGIMGSGIQNLNVDSVRKYRMPITSLEEQNEIVNEVERRLSLIREVELQVAVNLLRVERLRQTILRQAFAGKLALKENN